jgi:hypothetical protein
MNASWGNFLSSAACAQPSHNLAHFTTNEMPAKKRKKEKRMFAHSQKKHKPMSFLYGIKELVTS